MLKNKFFKKLITLALVASMLASMVACGNKDTDAPNTDTSTSVSQSTSNEVESPKDETISSPENKKPEDNKTSSASSSTTTQKPKPVEIPKETRTPEQIQKDILTSMVNFKNKYNKDVVGYLYFPNTKINDVVLQGKDNDYYLKRDKYGNSQKNGTAYFADFRANLTAGKPLSKNTTIYAHSINDNKDGENFSQLKKLTDFDFAKDNQFIYFSTPEKGMVWQIFAAFYVKVGDADYLAKNPQYNYIDPNFSNENMMKVINMAKAGSLYNYNVDVNTKDNILTLSTCTYHFDKEWKFPNDYRFVVMAKLLPDGAKQTPAQITKNENVVMPGKMYR